MAAPKKAAKKAPVKREGNKVFVPRNPQPKQNYLATITDEDEAQALIERKCFYEDKSLIRKDCVIQDIDFIDGKLANVRILLHEGGAWATEPLLVHSDQFERITLV
jgi:hypothetical protein